MLAAGPSGGEVHAIGVPNDVDVALVIHGNATGGVVTAAADVGCPQDELSPRTGTPGVPGSSPVAKAIPVDADCSWGGR